MLDKTNPLTILTPMLTSQNLHRLDPTTRSKSKRVVVAGVLSEAREYPFLCFNRKSLETILPHRGAALRKIDGALYCSSSPNFMTGVKGISIDDTDLEGHFPGAPTYPGYAQDEFACLVAAALIPMSVKGLDRDPYVVQKVVRYKKNAGPGDTLFADVRLLGRKAKFFIFSAEIRNQKDEVIAEYEKIVGAA